MNGNQAAVVEAESLIRAFGDRRAVDEVSLSVHAGETLWGVARRVAPGQDPRAVVAKIRELNHLSSATLQIGQQLLIPHAA